MLKRVSVLLPVVEFALTSLHISTGYTPIYLIGLTHSHVPLTLLQGDSGSLREIANLLAEYSSVSVKQQVSEFLAALLNVVRHVRDAVDDS